MSQKPSLDEDSHHLKRSLCSKSSLCSRLLLNSVQRSKASIKKEAVIRADLKDHKQHRDYSLARYPRDPSFMRKQNDSMSKANLPNDVPLRLSKAKNTLASTLPSTKALSSLSSCSKLTSLAQYAFASADKALKLLTPGDFQADFALKLYRSDRDNLLQQIKKMREKEAQQSKKQVTGRQGKNLGKDGFQRESQRSFLQHSRLQSMAATELSLCQESLRTLLSQSLCEELLQLIEKQARFDGMLQRENESQTRLRDIQLLQSGVEKERQKLLQKQRDLLLASNQKTHLAQQISELQNKLASIGQDASAVQALQTQIDQLKKSLEQSNKKYDKLQAHEHLIKSQLLSCFTPPLDSSTDSLTFIQILKKRINANIDQRYFVDSEKQQFHTQQIKKLQELVDRLSRQLDCKNEQLHLQLKRSTSYLSCPTQTGPFHDYCIEMNELREQQRLFQSKTQKEQQKLIQKIYLLTDSKMKLQIEIKIKQEQNIRLTVCLKAVEEEMAINKLQQLKQRSENRQAVRISQQIIIKYETENKEFVEELQKKKQQHIKLQSLIQKMKKQIQAMQIQNINFKQKLEKEKQELISDFKVSEKEVLLKYQKHLLKQQQFNKISNLAKLQKLELKQKQQKLIENCNQFKMKAIETQSKLLSIQKQLNESKKEIQKCQILMRAKDEQRDVYEKQWEGILKSATQSLKQQIVQQKVTISKYESEITRFQLEAQLIIQQQEEEKELRASKEQQYSYLLKQILKGMLPQNQTVSQIGFQELLEHGAEAALQMRRKHRDQDSVRRKESTQRSLFIPKPFVLFDSFLIQTQTDPIKSRQSQIAQKNIEHSQVQIETCTLSKSLEPQKGKFIQKQDRKRQNKIQLRSEILFKAEKQQKNQYKQLKNEQQKETDQKQFQQFYGDLNISEISGEDFNATQSKNNQR